MFDLRLSPHFAVYTLKCLEGGADNAVPTDCPVSGNRTTLCSYDRTNIYHNDWNHDNFIKSCATLGSVDVLDRIKLDRDACFKFASGKHICYCKRDNCNNDCTPGTCKPYLAARITTLKEICNAQCVTPRVAVRSDSVSSASVSVANETSAEPEVAVASKEPVTSKVSSIAPTPKRSKASTSSGKPPNEVMTKTNSSNYVTPCTIFHVAILMFLIITRKFNCLLELCLISNLMVLKDGVLKDDTKLYRRII